MKISQRAYVGFGLVLALLVGMVILNDRTTRRSRQDLVEVRRQAALVSSAHQLDRDVLKLQLGALAFTNTGHPAVGRRVTVVGQRIAETLAQIDAGVESAELTDLHDRLATLRSAYMEAFERLREDRQRRDELLDRFQALGIEVYAQLAERESAEHAGLAARVAFSAAERAMMSYVESPDFALVTTMKEHLRATTIALHASGDDKIAYEILEYEDVALQMVQSIRGYLFLANVVLAGQAAEFAYQTDRFQEHVKRDTATVLIDLEAATSNSQAWSMLIGLLALVSGGAASWLVGRSITVPLTHMTQTFAQLARGEDVEEIPGLERRDEIGAMASAAQVFKERNQQTEDLLALSRERGDQLDAQARDLEQANAELQQFAYVASHDLQEPLRMVACYVQLLREEYSGRLSEEADEYIGFASEGAQRMQALINDLLELGRIGRAPKEPVSVNTATLMRDVCKDLEQSLAACDAKINLGDLPEVLGFPTQLRQAFQNFLTNAIKYRRPDAGLVIDVHATETEDGWSFCFADNGIGIDAEHYERIFKIFQRLHVRAEYEGSGIGLAIVKKVAERHNGSVSVESRPADGTRFHFRLGRIAA